MPVVARIVEIRPNEILVDGEALPFYISDDGISVECGHGASLVTVSIIADGVLIEDKPRPSAEATAYLQAIRDRIGAQDGVAV